MTDDVEMTAILDGVLECYQPRGGYRFSVDSLLLAGFVLENVGKHGDFVELGGGCGVVSALVARGGGMNGVLVELQPPLHRCAVATLERNGLSERVRTVLGDIRDLSTFVAPGSYRVVISNPPFFCRKSGRLSPDLQEAIARHEVECTMADVLSAARYILPPGGKGYFIYSAHRLGEIMSLLPTFKLRPVKLQMVHGNAEKPASSFLVEVGKSSRHEMKVLPPLFVKDRTGGEGEWYSRLNLALTRVAG